MLAEVEEPPDSHDQGYFWTRTQGFESSPAKYTKQLPLNSRRESLLTRQLHSETEHTEDEAPTVQEEALSLVAIVFKTGLLLEQRM